VRQEDAHIFPVRVFLPHIHNLLDESGRLQDAELITRLRSQAEGFVGFVEKLKGVNLRAAK